MVGCVPVVAHKTLCKIHVKGLWNKQLILSHHTSMVTLGLSSNWIYPFGWLWWLFDTLPICTRGEECYEGLHNRQPGTQNEGGQRLVRLTFLHINTISVFSIVLSAFTYLSWITSWCITYIYLSRMCSSIIPRLFPRRLTFDHIIAPHG